MKAIGIVSLVVAVAFIFLFGFVLMGCGVKPEQPDIPKAFQPLEEMGGEG